MTYDTVKLTRRTFHVLVNESASPRLLKGTKDLFPCDMKKIPRKKKKYGQ